MRPQKWTWITARVRDAFWYRCGLIWVADVLFVGRLLSDGTFANLLGEQESCRARFDMAKR